MLLIVGLCVSLVLCLAAILFWLLASRPLCAQLFPHCGIFDLTLHPRILVFWGNHCNIYQYQGNPCLDSTVTSGQRVLSCRISRVLCINIALNISWQEKKCLPTLPFRDVCLLIMGHQRCMHFCVCVHIYTCQCLRKSLCSIPDTYNSSRISFCAAITYQLDCCVTVYLGACSLPY